MKIRMLNDVAPEDFGIQGQSGWMETIQWRAGQIYDLEPIIADVFVMNKDAEYVEGEENGTD